MYLKQKSDRYQEAKDPDTFMSKSEGAFRVIRQGVPLSRDQPTWEAALIAARLGSLKLDAQRYWNGDAGQWEAAPGAKLQDFRAWAASENEKRRKRGE